MPQQQTFYNRQHGYQKYQCFPSLNGFQCPFQDYFLRGKFISLSLSSYRVYEKLIFHVNDTNPDTLLYSKTTVFFFFFQSQLPTKMRLQKIGGTFVEVICTVVIPKEQKQFISIFAVSVQNVIIIRTTNRTLKKSGK